MTEGTVPSSYAKEFAMPDGFPDVVSKLAREILREQPADIEAFCLQYFSEKMQNDASQHEMPSKRSKRNSILEDPDPGFLLTEMSPQEIEELIHSLFREQDVDANHTLDRHEFKMVFNKLGAKLGLRKNDVRRILAEADRDENGLVSYAEFIPVAMGVIQTLVAKHELRQEEERQAKVKEEAESHIYHGMPHEELEEILTSIFREADTDGNGTLDLDEFERCLADIRIGMTRKEINVLMFETYADNDGKIAYEAFKPLCMELLAELTAQEWMAPSQDVQDIQVAILEAFQKADKTESGMLSHEQLQSVLSRMDLGLTLLQICSILSETKEDDRGMIDYGAEVSRVAFMVHSCMHYSQKLVEKQERMQTLHASDGWGMVFGRDRDQLEEELLAAFRELDEDGAGCLTREEIKTTLKSILPELDRPSMHALLALAQQTETAQYRYKPVVEHAFGLMELAIIVEDDE
ncbi:Calmodulin-like protein [Hondaea fermentalgiana]|uniref:Calmodulin n=1 Tax=Hondaea fermentalgiana TaxID=2315210 RepID=A0A2R5GCF7_9STRA|nr:Calmodulin-like protein [Hondaea fermentalgiana]|eukprot:GBG26283.1 Calmodulin-like protein [Hondaea fermentalgiana]